jgi:hypothetical protein
LCGQRQRLGVEQGDRVPGQGQGVSVRVFRIRGSSMDGSNTVSTLNYRAPVFSSFALLDPIVGSAWSSTVAVTARTTVVVPTDGSARLRIIGSDLGLDPVVVVGDSYRLSGSDLEACPGTAGLHTCIEFAAPAGEGTGTDYPQFPLGYVLLLEAGNQATASAFFQYKKPTASRIVPLPGSGFPTRGGVSVTVEGRDFGVTRTTRPDAAIVVEFGRTTESLWLACTDAVRVSHTQITCTLPEGSGFGLSVRIRVAEEDNIQVSTGASFSYDAPVVSTVNIPQRQA